MRVDVIFRSSSRFRAASDQPLIRNIAKAEILMASLFSLINSLEFARLQGLDFQPHLMVMDDHSEEMAIEWIQKLLKKYPGSSEFVPLKDSGEAALAETAILKCKDRIRGHHSEESWVYFAEDDFIHEQNAVFEIFHAAMDFKKQFQWDEIILQPYESLKLYQADAHASLVLKTPYRHWRSIFRAQGSFLISTQAFLDQEKNSQIPTFSPMPSLGFPMRDASQLPPFTAWERQWENTYSSLKEFLL